MEETKMSQNSENVKYVKTYLKQIEEKLPEWLKEKKSELNDLLDEIEQHIWDKIEEITQGQPASLIEVQKAIASMGSPEKIANEYKRRGTPKVYITQELWPIYLKGLKIIFSILLILNIVGFIFSVADGEVGDAIWNLLSGVFNAFVISSFIITLIFVGLSMEGYLPEDFETKEEKAEKETQKKLGIGESIKKEENPIKIGELIFGSVSALIFGFLLLTQSINPFEIVFDPQFIAVMQYSGLIFIISGVLHFGRVLLGQKSLSGHQILMTLDIIFGLFFIPIGLIVINNPEIFPFFNVIDIQEIYNGVALGFKIFIGFVIFGSVVAFYEMVTLKSKHARYLAYKNMFNS